MTRGLVLLAAALALAWAAEAGAESRGQKAQKSPAVHELPLHIYLAKGEANACGEGCSEWIAVEGRFDAGSAGRAQAFLRRHAARKLPVYFHSPGGSGPDAIAIGRQLRQLGITVGVAATVPRGCASARDTAAACAAAKRSPQPVLAEWRPDASCSSACVWALLGGKVRHVPPAARLGIHSGKMTLTRRWSDGRVQQVSPKEAAHKTRAAKAVANARRYIRDMGIDTALMDEALKVPHEDIRYLSRGEIAGFGIDRRAFAESPWFFTEFSSGARYVSKWIVEARGPERIDYRVSVVMFRCSSAHHAAIQYLRGLASDEVGRPAVATFAIGKHKARFTLRGDGTKQDAIDGGTQFSSAASYAPFDEVETAVAHGAIGIIETGVLADAKQQRVIELSTHGLADAIKQLREKCIPVAQPAPWVAPVKSAPWAPPAQVPFVPAQAGGESAPASPYGAYPVPERGLGTGGRVSREEK
jgi:hypothetical protein